MIHSEPHFMHDPGESAVRFEMSREKFIPREEVEKMIDLMDSTLNKYPRDKNDFRLTEQETQKKKNLIKSRFAVGSLWVIADDVKEGMNLLKEYQWDTQDLQKGIEEIFDGFVRRQPDGSEKQIRGMRQIIKRKNALTTTLYKKIPDELADFFGCEKAILVQFVTHLSLREAAELLADKRGLNIMERMVQAEELQKEAEEHLLPLHKLYREELTDPTKGAMVSEELVARLEQLVEETCQTLQQAVNPSERLQQMA